MDKVIILNLKKRLIRAHSKRRNRLVAIELRRLIKRHAKKDEFKISKKLNDFIVKNKALKHLRNIKVVLKEENNKLLADLYEEIKNDNKVSDTGK